MTGVSFLLSDMAVDSGVKGDGDDKDESDDDVDFCRLNLLSVNCLNIFSRNI